MSTATDLMPLDGMNENHPLDVTDRIGAGQTMQQVRTPYCTALSVQKPRNIASVQARLLQEADLCGEEFYYGWGAGGNRIEGPSKELAFAAARCWGNCAVQALPMQETADSWIFTAAFVDLETGFTMERSFRQSKMWTVHGKMDVHRKDDIRFQIGQSKAARNVVLNCLPATLIHKAMERAKAGVRSRIEEYIKAKGIVAAVDVTLRALAKHGIKEEQVLRKLSVQDKKAIDVDAIVILKGDLTAIEGGQERAEDLYPATAGALPANGTGSKADALADRLAPAPAATQTPTAAPESAAPEPAPAATPQTPAEQPKPAATQQPVNLFERYKTAISAAKTVEDVTRLKAEIDGHGDLMQDEKMELLDQADGKTSFLSAKSGNKGGKK